MNDQADPLSGRDRETLREIEDALRRDDPDLLEIFDHAPAETARGTHDRRKRWYAAGAVCGTIALFAALFAGSPVGAVAGFAVAVVTIGGLVGLIDVIHWFKKP